MTAASSVLGVILAGGLSRRMGGGDKCLRPLGGRPILAHIAERAAPQVGALVLNANGDPARFAAFALPVVPDVVAGFAGPLAGVLTGMEWAAARHPELRWIATFAADAPFFPRDYVACMIEAVRAEHADMAAARSLEQDHPVFGLWPVRLRDDLRQAMTEEGIRKVDVWTARHHCVTVEFPAIHVDPFFNANAPADLAEAERLLPLVERAAAP
jgi:molybdopterin-guanine dinucleotide biosynthesis protein A